jgi:uncharacterized membrane protein
MTKTNALSRRKLLGRIGLLAAAGYTVPALTTLSMAQAGSGASGGGSSAPSAPSNSNSGPSAGAGGGQTLVDPQAQAKFDACGVENLNDPAYLQCLVAAGF